MLSALSMSWGRIATPRPTTLEQVEMKASFARVWGEAVDLGEMTPEMDRELPMYREMLRRLAADPVDHTLQFELLLRLFLQHVWQVPAIACLLHAESGSRIHKEGRKWRVMWAKATPVSVSLILNLIKNPSESLCNPSKV